MKPITFPRLTLADPGSRVAPTLGHPPVDDSLESVHARLRPNSTLAFVDDLKVFFAVIDVDPLDVRRRHVLEFIRVQRTGTTDAMVLPIDSSEGWRCRRSIVGCRRWRVLWIGHLLRDDAEPAHFDDWERGWVPAELLRPVGELN